MRTLILSTSTVALIAATGPADANEWDVDVGGFMEQWIGYSDVDVDNLDDTDFDGFDVKSDAEIAFVPSITLDNGLRFGANVQLEANTSGDQIDESYLFVQGSFGEVLLGSENSAGYKMSYGAPDVTVIGYNSGSTTAFAPISGSAIGGSGTAVQTGDDFFRRTLGTTFIENMGNNDAQRITYFSPRFFGFQVGGSYARDGTQDNNAQLNTEVVGTLSDIVDFGANYVNSFGDFNVAIAGRYGFADFQADKDDEEEPEIWGASANLGYAGFTVGGSYAEQNDAGTDDGEAWDVGAAYETGPWGFSFGYFNGENVDDEFPGTDEEVEIYLAGASYTVAQGVKLGAFAGYQEFDEEIGDDGTSGGDDIENWFVGTSAAIAF